NTDGGFGLDLNAEERFSRSISFVGDLRGDGTIAVNYGGGAGAGSAGILYLLFFKPCDFNQESGFNHWSGGNTLYSNWTHSTQTVSDSLTFEQCTFKAFETDAAYVTYNFNDGRCICKDPNAVLTVSTELSTAYTNQCHSGVVLSTEGTALNNEHILVYPNPTNSTLVVRTEQTKFTQGDKIELLSISGRKLYSSPIYSTDTPIDMLHYPQGAYLIVITLDGKSKAFKILKQ
ncbi:MAG: T9SS type A sorting domain-containing protein, partial [Saprospiraceae bacterium]|nr:T9SS type A sorting domain-containing protein [Saprospiraceae bacterium]